METSLPVVASERPPAPPFALWPTIGLIALAIVAGFMASISAAIVGILAYGMLLGGHAFASPAVTESLKNPSGIFSLSIETVFYIAEAGVVLLLLPFVAKRSLGELGIGLRSLRQWRPILIGIAGGAAIHFGSSLYFVATHQGDHVQHGFEHFAPKGQAEILTSILAIAIVGPIGEELFFRAVLFRALVARYPLGVSALVSGAIFGALHFDLVVFPVLMLLGVAGAIVYARTGNLWSAIAMHASNNGIALLALAIDPSSKV